MKRILMLQLGTVAGRFASLKATVSEGSPEAPLAFQCKLVTTVKNGGRLEGLW
jgi:hypothetical protein